MPTRPPRPCRASGCPALVRGVSSYCDAHRKAEHRRVDAGRAGRDQRGYDWAWRTRVRPAALAREPLCRSCAEQGRIRAATEVDHIDGDSRNNAAENLRGLCKPCHSRRTATDQAFGRKHAKG